VCRRSPGGVAGKQAIAGKQESTDFLTEDYTDLLLIKKIRGYQWFAVLLLLTTDY